ncbi:coiled-coil domain-containing protein [Methylomarinum vadi]|uniref:hypothetical protein n=1 Tax=Methylomarinum vadi TaxID=438855 RepID=UPI0004DFB5BD|nr:hypothetical protein [Methylomarinum vadi]
MLGKPPSADHHAGYVLDIRKIFLAALVLGVVGIVLPQSFGYHQLSVAIPLLLMALYAAIGYRRGKDSPFLEQFADSVYYLGFLFTLIALVVSLYHYRGDSLGLDAIIANFSLALTTTIFGLAVRIYINNFQVDLRSAERQMLEGVELAANDFVRKAKTLSMQLELSHDETQRAIRRALEDAGQSMSQTAAMIREQAEQSAEAFRKQSETANRSMEETIKALQQKLESLELPEDIFARRLEAPLTALNEKLVETRTVVSDLAQEQTVIKADYRQMTLELGHFNSALTASGRSLEAFNDNIAAHNLSSEEFVQLVERFKQLAQASDAITAAIGEQAERSSAAAERFETLLASFGQLPDETERIAARLNQASDEVVGLFARISGQTENSARISSDLQTIAEALSKTQLTIKQISDFGVHVTSAFKRLESFNQAIEQHTRNLQAMGNLADTDIALIKTHQQEMAAILEHSRTAMAMMNRHFVDSIDYLSKRLED